MVRLPLSVEDEDGESDSDPCESNQTFRYWSLLLVHLFGILDLHTWQTHVYACVNTWSMLNPEESLC